MEYFVAVDIAIRMKDHDVCDTKMAWEEKIHKSW